MKNGLLAVNDLMILIFDIILYMKFVSLRWNSRRAKAVLFSGCGAMLFLYTLAAYHFHVPVSVALFLCFTLPGFLLFYIFSTQRDSRFVMTFCFVDTLSLLLLFLSQGAAFLWGTPGALISGVFAVLLFINLLHTGRDFFKTYHQLLTTATLGWDGMALATVVIYFAILFFAAYPRPIAARPEYFPVWLVFALVVLSCYHVFIQSIFKTKQIVEQKLHLEHENRIFSLAYTDALTGLKNRAAYIDTLNSTERLRPLPVSLCCLVMDLNNFKSINDTFGHAVGDTALKSTAICLHESFSDLDASIFRVGGDEFYLLLQDVTAEQIKNHLRRFDDRLLQMGNELSLYLTAARGYAFVPEDLSVTIEMVFDQADQAMYEDKRSFHEKREQGKG